MVVLNAFQAWIYHQLIKNCLLFHSFYTSNKVVLQSNCIQSKISPYINTLLNGALRPKLPNSHFASWFLINLDFLLPHIAHYKNIIALRLLVLEIFGFMFSVSFLYFKQ